MNARDVPRPIQWHEGMLLGPHHFQQLDLRYEQLLAFHAGALSSYHWGVRHLRFDPVLLADGTLRVLELDVIMPDGLVVSHLADDDPELSLDLTSRADEIREKPVLIQLTVPATRRSGSAVTGELARFESVEGSSVTDLNTGEGELRVPRLRPRLGLRLGDVPPQRHTAIPLGQVGYREEAFALTEYAPPQLQVAESSALGRLCSRVATRVRQKAIALGERVASRSAPRGAPQFLHTRMLLGGLVAELMRFEAMVSSGNTHPWQLYLGLCGLVGHVAGIGSGRIPHAMPAYDHADPRSCYEYAIRFIDESLDESVSLAFTSNVLAQKDGMFSIRFQPVWVGHPLVLGVTARAGIAEESVDVWVSNAVVASESKLEGLRERRVLGLPRRKYEGSELFPARGVLLYELDADPEVLEPDQPLVVVNLADPDGSSRPLEIVLHVGK